MVAKKDFWLFWVSVLVNRLILKDITADEGPAWKILQGTRHVNAIKKYLSAGQFREFW